MTIFFFIPQNVLMFCFNKIFKVKIHNVSIFVSQASVYLMLVLIKHLGL